MAFDVRLFVLFPAISAVDFLAEAKLSKEGSIKTWTILGFDPIRKDAWTDPAMKADNEFTQYFGKDVFDTVSGIVDSMKNNATDYILKHIVDEKTMLEVLEEISKGFIKDEMLEKQMIESRTVLKQRFFNQLVSGTINELNEIKEKIESLNIPLDTRDLIIILFELDDFYCCRKNLPLRKPRS